eukprot:TRINITY_DN27463_c0_g1_i1.p1 TRINITY_DN27463_c0_g1~~TRINITY_DN27463_c0_g1_i1.p1  ORF type:complete len:375 (-),score=27.62 TRINITY_DN27463_c0_g1_i1:769-1893(-)
MARIFPDENTMMYWASLGMNGEDDEQDDLSKRADLRSEMFIQSEIWSRPNAFHLGPKLPSGEYTGVKITRRQYILRYFESQILDLVDRAKHIEHPNLVPYLGCAIDYHRDEIQIWQEHVQGVNLDSQMKTRKRGYDDLTVKSFLTFILRGVQCLHDNEIVHTRITPAKIILNRDGVPVLCDYCSPASTYKPLWLGKYRHVMAPEIHTGMGYTMASDIWSIGVLCLHLYSGNPPFINQPSLVDRLTLPLESGTVNEEEEDEQTPVGSHNAKINHKKIRPITKEEIEYYPFIPDDAMQWALRCLAMLPEDRPTAEELLESDFLCKPQVVANVNKMQRFADGRRSSRILVKEQIEAAVAASSRGEEEESESEESDGG